MLRRSKNELEISLIAVKKYRTSDQVSLYSRRRATPQINANVRMLIETISDSSILF